MIVSYSARFLLIVAASTCPCAAVRAVIVCVPATRRRYQNRLVEPVADRLDI
ncbi:ATP-binding protein [Nocardia brasiliensis]|uniref:ATP-binding protein n=1 Tax=Nocardia brasiliensis TaxID=37326 RepID=UPI003CC7C690